MKDVFRVVGNILLYAFALVVVFWTASLTVSLVSRLLPGDPITPYFALALFDGGALIWLVVFIAKARGLMQRGVSILMMSLDLVGVVLISIAELFLGGQNLVAIPENLGRIAIWTVGGWTALNLVALYVFHITDPAVNREIELQTQQDKIESEAMKQARAQLEGLSIDLGNRLAAGYTRQALYNLGLLVNQNPVIDINSRDADEPNQDPPTTEQVTEQSKNGGKRAPAPGISMAFRRMTRNGVTSEENPTSPPRPTS